MRRALLCCALVAFATAACSSSSASPTPGSPFNPYYPVVPTAAASAAGAIPVPNATAMASIPSQWQQPTPYPWQTQYPWQTPAPTVGQPYPPVTFPSLGTNPYVDTMADHLSTFALDVDTASYTVARSYIASGIRPDPDSIRPEEWVNYFDQGYAAPESGTFAIHIDGGPTPFLSSGEVLLRVGVKARETTATRRPSAALTFVVDVSGSMADGGRLELVKQSLVMLVDQLRPDDSVAIVAFTSDAYVILYPTSAENRQSIVSAIASLYPQQSTNVEAGLRLGYDIARKQYKQDGINRVVLATDGVANAGNVDPQGMLAEIGQASTDHIQMVAIGVGMGNYNDALLEQIADEGQGFYAYIDNLDEARKVFVDELTTTIDTVAIDAKAQIDFNPATVAGYRLIGYEDRGVPDDQFRSSTQKGGGIGAGHEVTALYAIVPRASEGSDRRLATVSLRWTDPKSGESTEMARDLNRGDLATSFDRADAHFKLDSLVAATAELLRRSPWIPGYRMTDLQAAAAALRWQLPGDDRAQDFLLLIQQIRTWD
jgi:Ca-activated chloride channel family protein